MDPSVISRTTLFESLLENYKLDILSQFSMDYQRNVYIIERIRMLKTPDLFLFIETLKKIGSQKAIGDTLLEGTCCM